MKSKKFQKVLKVSRKANNKINRFEIKKNNKMSRLEK